MADRFHQRRQAKAEAERQRDTVLGPIATAQAREGSVFDLLLATSGVTPLWAAGPIWPGWSNGGMTLALARWRL